MEHMRAGQHGKGADLGMTTAGGAACLKILENARSFGQGVNCFDYIYGEQGVVHVLGPEGKQLGRQLWLKRRSGCCISLDDCCEAFQG